MRENLFFLTHPSRVPPDREIADFFTPATKRLLTHLEGGRQPECLGNGVPFAPEMSIPKWKARDLPEMRGSLK